LAPVLAAGSAVSVRRNRENWPFGGVRRMSSRQPAAEAVDPEESEERNRVVLT
jgi:hypothetical protein